MLFTAALIAAQFGLVLAAISQVSAPPAWNVVRLDGAARCQVGTNNWQPLMRGASVSPGSVVETASGKSLAEFLLAPQGSTSLRGKSSGDNPAQWPWNPALPGIRLYADSALSFFNLTAGRPATATPPSGSSASRLQFELLMGRILVTAEDPNASTTTDVKFSTGMVESRTAQYNLTREGIITVMAGSNLRDHDESPSVGAGGRRL